MAKNSAKIRKPASFVIEGKRRRSTLSMAPLIDFTFILLIFFMLVTQFDRFTPVDITMRKTPIKTATPPLSPLPGKRLEKLHLRLRADGGFELDGKDIGGLEKFTGILAHHQPLGKQDAAQKPLLLVDPEGEVSVQLLIDTMNALKSLPGFVVRIVMRPGRATPDQPAAAIGKDGE